MRFSAQSVYLLNPRDAACLASWDGDVEGMIIGFSDSGAQAKAYAVVEVVRRMSLVVSVEGLSLVSSPDEKS